MKIQTIKNKMYKQLGFEPDMVGRIFISSVINEACLEGKKEILEKLNFEEVSQEDIEKEIKELTEKEETKSQ